MMTRRHFEAIAATLRNARGPYRNGIINQLAEDFADFCEGESGNFNRQKFIQATKLETPK